MFEAAEGVWAGLAVVVDQLSAETRQQLAPVTHIVSAAELGEAN